jgi:hypothetical protein
MTTTPVLNVNSATIVADDASPRFNWTAAFAGALAATAVTFFLISLGTGVGLALVSARQTTAPTFLTLGGIYFLAAQAFGFAVGGHLAGRLIGPAIETTKEEEFRAGMHGLVVWALAVTATATMVALSAMTAGSTVAQGVLQSKTSNTAQAPSPDVTGYWADMLFRPATQRHASLDEVRFAQLTPEPSSDAAPAPVEAPAISPSGPPTSTIPVPRSAPSGRAIPPVEPVALPSDVPNAQTLAADKSEAERIIARDMARGGNSLPMDDRNQLALLVQTHTGLPFAAAADRVNDVQAKMAADITATAEAARKTASYASLWTAFALLFGAIVSVAAAISARWQDDKRTFRRIAPTG